MTILLSNKCYLFAGLLSWLSVTSRAAYTPGTPHDAVVQLDKNSFPEAINDPANPLWFLKFYAPWCGHCKRMAPVLDRIAPKLQGQMAIGKIDCTSQTALCKQFKVRGYPTLKYSVDGDINDYPAGRDEASILGFASKMSAPSIVTVGSYDEAMEYAKSETEEGVIFLGFDPSHSEAAPSAFYQVFSQVARRKQASGHFLWLKPSDPDSIKSAAVVKRIEVDTKVRYLEDVESLTPEALGEWFEEQNLPLVSILGANNFQKIGRKGRPLAMAIAHTEDAEQIKALKEHMLNYITATDDEKYYYGILDGKKFNKFLEQFNVKEENVPQFLVFDVPSKTYWQNETYTNLFEFMKAIENGELPSSMVTKSGGNGVLAKIEHYFVKFFPYSVVVLLLIVIVFMWLIIPAYEEDPDGGNHSALDDILEDMQGVEGEKQEAEEAEKTKEVAESKKDK
eukprot:scaffold443_cov125-Cylindrotheca_fusiformis.AAC.22